MCGPFQVLSNGSSGEIENAEIPGVASSLADAIEESQRSRPLRWIIVAAEKHCSQEFAESIVIQPFETSNQLRTNHLAALFHDLVTNVDDFLRTGSPVAVSA
jgi:hypothetical protein